MSQLRGMQNHGRHGTSLNQVQFVTSAGRTSPLYGGRADEPNSPFVLDAPRGHEIFMLDAQQHWRGHLSEVKTQHRKIFTTWVPYIKSLCSSSFKRLVETPPGSVPTIPDDETFQGVPLSGDNERCSRCGYFEDYLCEDTYMCFNCDTARSSDSEGE